MPRNSKSSKKINDNHVRIRSKFSSVSAVNTATTAQNLGNIGTDATGILANDVNLASLTDMFRLFRVNKIVFHMQPSSGTSTAAVSVPSGFMAAIPFGTTASPTGIDSAETPNVSNPTIPFSTAASTAPLTAYQGTTLKLKNGDMPVLQGPGGGWLSTQADGSQTNYGTLWWLTTAATAANTLNYILRTVFDISFKDLLDPSLISSLMSRHPTGLPGHWELAPGTLLHSVNQGAKQGLKFSPVDQTPGIFSAAFIQSARENQRPSSAEQDADDTPEAVLTAFRHLLATQNGNAGPLLPRMLQ